jgi:hypothetical protein
VEIGPKGNDLGAGIKDHAAMEAAYGCAGEEPQALQVIGTDGRGRLDTQPGADQWGYASVGSQLRPLGLSEEEKHAPLAFLGSLTGEIYEGPGAVVNVK